MSTDCSFVFLIIPIANWRQKIEAQETIVKNIKKCALWAKIFQELD